MQLHELLVFDDIVIQCHDNPDADALASGYALWWYFKLMGKKSRFIYRGRNMLQKSNLMIMVDKLQIPVEYESDFEDNPELLVTVDCQYGEKNVTATRAKNIAVIDHHQLCADNIEMKEVRSSVGSCSTVIWDMMRCEGINVNENKLLATALFYGLFTDTNKFAEMVHPLDRDMVDSLIINRSIITEMSNSNISLRELKIAGRAILGYDYNYDDRFVVIEAERCDPNILGVISDFVMETAGVNVCLAYYVSDSEIKFSVRSCVKEVHANELADFLAKDIGGGGGHLYKAGGTVRPENLSIALEEVEHLDFRERIKLNMIENESGIKKKIELIFKDRLKKYFSRYEILYSKNATLDKKEMKLYEKIPQELGAVKLTDVYPAGTKVEIRTLEGDIELIIDNDKYLMIGIEGEVYPISAEKLNRSYKSMDKPFNKKFEYAPRIKNISSNEIKLVQNYSNTVISVVKTKIYAKPLKRSIKLFTEWDEEKYYSGEPGDYLACRVDDDHDIYIIQGRLFNKLYSEVD
ncbi:MAG: DHH family phosphoesterase [Eubacterium sp.]|nr:DHH family phosphoesterase [Eubacterium sp.]